MHNDDLVLTIDFGTQSVRALIFNAQGEILVMEKVVYSPAYFSVKPGYCEQDPLFYWEMMCQATQALRRNNPQLIDRVKGVTLACFRDCAVLLDENKKVIRPSILWLDQRLASGKKKMPFINTLLFKIVGMYGTAEMNNRRTMANWYQENEIENWQKTKYYVNISTYFTYLLTGFLKDTPSNYAGHYPIDMKRGKWFKKSHLKACVFNIPAHMLCELVPSGELIGIISEECSLQTGLPRVPFYVSGTDKGAETIGTGCLYKNMASVSYGTASTIEVTNKKYIEPTLFLPAYPAIIPNYYNMEAQVYRGYWMITWFKEQFASEENIEAHIQKLAVEEVLNKKFMEIPPGSQGLVLQPYWGPGLKRPEARGAIIGFSDAHTKIHIYRAIVEGIAFELLDSLKGIEKRQRHKVTEIRVSGGGSQSDAICQTTADIFGIPVCRVQTYETACLGVAITAFKAIGRFSTYEKAIEAMVKPQKAFIPNPEAHAQYDYLYKNVYKKMYPKLRGLYKKLRYFK